MEAAEDMAEALVQEMGHVTVAQQIAKIMSFTCRVLTGTLLFFLLCLAIFPQAKAAEQDFERSGIHFPGGFDLNTVGELIGKIASLYRPSGNGPVILNVATEWEKYAIITCPPWYWDDLKVKVSSGEEVRVIGSKSLGKDSNLYIIAQEIQFISQGKTLTLRSKAGTPLWSGPHGKTGSLRNSGNQGRGKKQQF